MDADITERGGPDGRLAPMPDELMSTTQWARAGTTLALWMALPLLIGLWRVTRGDVRWRAAARSG